MISDVLYPAKLQSKPAALCFSSLGVKVAEELVLLVIVRSFSLCGSQWKRSWPLGSSSIWHFDLGVLSPMQSHPWRRQVVCVCVCARSIVHVALTSMSEIRRKFARQLAMVYPKDFQKFLEPCICCKCLRNDVILIQVSQSILFLQGTSTEGKQTSTLHLLAALSLITVLVLVN